jgi:3',5'-cyclic AMP phosphodiesterase CpdA
MNKILVLTDLHLCPAGDEIIGLDPSARFAACLAAAAKDHPDADHLILCGDLAHHGPTKVYTNLRTQLADAPWPVTLMLGNHDNRANFQEVFPEAPITKSGHVQSIIDLPEHRLICLDTLDGPPAPPDQHSGYLCSDRLEWLRTQLDTADKCKVIIFAHHPVLDIGFDGMDAIKLRNSDAFLDLIGQYPNVAHLVFGHLHRTISGSIRGIPFSIFKSPCDQMPLLLGVPGTSHSVDEPGAYGLLLLNSDSIVVHSEDVGLNATTYQREP